MGEFDSVAGEANSPAPSASPRASGFPPSRRPAAAATSSAAHRPAAAATTSTVLTAGSSRSIRWANRCRIAAPGSSGTVSITPPPSCFAVSSADSSTSASGLPPVSSCSRLATAGAGLIPAMAPTSCAAALRPRPSSSRYGRPAGAGMPARTVITHAIASRSRRRSANSSASWLGGSSQCRSSTKTSSAPLSAAAVSRLWVPAATARRPGTPPSCPRPSAARSADACRSGSDVRLSATRCSSEYRPAKASSVSASIPVARRTCIDPAREAA